MFITEEQSGKLALLGVSSRQGTLDEIKQICPYTLSTGKNENGCYATTRINEPETYVYAETETEAAADLLIQQLTGKMYEPSACTWKTAARQQAKVGSLKK